MSRNPHRAIDDAIEKLIHEYTQQRAPDEGATAGTICEAVLQSLPEEVLKLYAKAMARSRAKEILDKVRHVPDVRDAAGQQYEIPDFPELPAMLSIPTSDSDSDVKIKATYRALRGDPERHADLIIKKGNEAVAKGVAMKEKCHATISGDPTAPLSDLMEPKHDDDCST